MRLPAGVYENKGAITNPSIIPTGFGILLVFRSNYYTMFIYMPSVAAPGSLYVAIITQGSTSIVWKAVELSIV